MADKADCGEQPGTVDLLDRARAGDAQAFCDLAASHEARLLQQACGLARDVSLAEDLVAETMIEAWRSLRRFNGTCRFSTWLFSILLHRHQKQLRRARSRPMPFASMTSAVAESLEQAQANLPDTGASPLDQAISRELASHLQAALEALPSRHRQVLLLRFFEGASLPEIAAALDCSVGTVKSRLHYALEKMRHLAVGLNLPEYRGDTSTGPGSPGFNEKKA